MSPEQQVGEPEGAQSGLRQTIRSASRGLVERQSLTEAIVLAAVAGEHLLVIGPPGTAKSEAVRRVATALGGTYFEYLIGRFTEPSEIFGPIDLRRLREGVVETETAGMLPEANFAFLDEVFLGSTAILNTLLGILNERVYRRGHTVHQCPLRICVGAANTIPADDGLAAFSDRFLVRCFVEPIPDPGLEDLLEQGWSLGETPAERPGSLTELDRVAEAARGADLSGIRPILADAIRMLRRTGIALTDRRAVKAQRLVAAAGALAGRSRPIGADLWPLILAVPTQEEQAAARDALRDLLADATNAVLPNAAEEASAGPAARAARLLSAGEALLGEPHDASATDQERWRLRLEGIVREIDASFAVEFLPEPLAALRDRAARELATELG
jgi:MoxR-like ATPase